MKESKNVPTLVYFLSDSLVLNSYLVKKFIGDATKLDDDILNLNGNTMLSLVR